jgi:ribosomal protein S18 acetylase RimI-like enzyme
LKPDAPRIRPGTATDRAFVERLSETAFTEYTLDARARAAPMTRAGTLLVAELGSRSVGFAVVRRQGRTAYLDAIAVETEWRGRGVGHALLAAAEESARRAGAARIELVTAEANLAALDLFLKRGFVVRRTVAGFYPRGQTAHVLDKALGRPAPD